MPINPRNKKPPVAGGWAKCKFWLSLHLVFPHRKGDHLSGFGSLGGCGKIKMHIIDSLPTV
jgi:hypothetical protein